MTENEITKIPEVVPIDQSSPDTDEAQADSRYQEVVAFIRDVIIIVISVLLVRTYLVAPFQISGDSMETSYHHKEFILVNKFSYADFWAFRVGDPDRGDVVILRPHAANGKEYYIKRVVGMPGDTIKFENGEVLIKTPGRTEFVKIDEDYLSAVTKGKTFLPMDIKETEFTVPDGQYFTMGDNRSNSSDSRSCFMSCNIPNSAHFVSRSNIIGKLFIDFGYVNIFGADGIIRTGEFKWTHPPRFLSTPKDWIYTEL